MNRLIYISFLVLVSCLSTTSCERRPEPLNRQTIRMIDTVAVKEIQKLRIELDSICDANFDDLVKSYMDSIKEVRLDEIRSLKE